MKHHNPLILSFPEIRAADLPIVGGKGANLGEMTHAGFPIPPGFCLTTAAFRIFTLGAPDMDSLYTRLDALEPDDIEGVREAGADIREALLNVPVPAEITAAVRDAWQHTGTDHAYAVRSSATAEDLPDASFAGQQDTFLNVIGEDALLDAVRRCWVSLFTDRAILYRARNDFAHRDVQLSVVVQQMIPAKVSGILFTADPHTGHRHTLAIDASFGLGEALVGGLVTPDTYHVDKRSRMITDRQIAEKTLGIFSKDGGGTRQAPIDDARKHQSALTDPQILALADLGARIEAHYGAPQDVEWALAPNGAMGADEDGLFILQSRPITSLYPIDGLSSPDDSLHVFFSMGHQQSMTRAMAPLSLSSLRELIPFTHSTDGTVSKIVRVSGGRVYVDLTGPLRNPLARRALLGLLSQLDSLAPDAVRQVIRRPEFEGPNTLHPSFAGIKFAAGLLRRVFAALWFRDLSGFCERTNERMDTYMQDVADKLQAVPPGKARLETAREIMPTMFPYFLNWVPEAAAGVVASRILPGLAARYLGPEDSEALSLGIPGNVVNEMNMAIGDLAELARACPPLADSLQHPGEDGHAWLAQAARIEGSRPFLDAWEAFIDQYGARGTAEIDIAVPRWYEDPLPVLQVIAANLDDTSGGYRARFAGFVRAREAAFQLLLESAGRGLFGWLRKRIYRRLYHTMTETGGMREHHKFLAVRLIAAVKEVLKETAGQLVAAGKLQQPDDVWYLEWPELFAICEGGETDWRGRITERRADLARFQKLTPPLIITSDGETPSVRHEVADAPEGALLGNPVSTGVVEGVVHVIRDPQRERLAAGEILVAEFTDPGWTPLFINAAGLVLEVGGALTHGAVVAREYGIPAVVGVRGATAALQTGQRVRVDGNRGVIEVLKEAGKTASG